MWILLVGGVATGYEAIGPFDSYRRARDYAQGDGGENRFASWVEIEVKAPEVDNED